MKEYKVVYRDGKIYKIIDKIYSEDSACMVLAMVIKAGYEDSRIEVDYVNPDESSPRVVRFDEDMEDHTQYMQMSYSDFYDIAEYGNQNWKGKFTPKEVAENAYRYYADYLWSIENKTISETIKTLYENLAEDISEEDMKTMPDSSKGPKYWMTHMMADLTSMSMELKEFVHKGLDYGFVKIIRNPNDDCIACEIGEYWFYFIGNEYENMTPNEVYESFTRDELTDMILNAMEDLDESEICYYKTYLVEKFKNNMIGECSV